MSRVNLPGASLEGQIRTSPGRHFRTSPGLQIGTSPGWSNRNFRGRPGDVGEGPILAGWVLSEKVTKHSKINLIEDDKIISRDDQITKKFSEYLINIPILNSPSNGSKCPDSSEQDPILKILDKYKSIYQYS